MLWLAIETQVLTSYLLSMHGTSKALKEIRLIPSKMWCFSLAATAMEESLAGKRTLISMFVGIPSLGIYLVLN